MTTDEEKDYYAILGVSPSATEDEIRHAYRALARRYHPDSRTEDVATTLFHEVQTAYAVLSDPLQRQAYDKRRSKAGLTETSALHLDIHSSQEQFSSLHEEQVGYFMADIRPGGTDQGERLPLNLCLVVDRSTSMQGTRMENVKIAAHQIIDELHEEDSFALVAFDDRAEVILPNQRNIDPVRAKSTVSSVWAKGGTEILQGIQAGLEEIERYHSDQVTSHLILLTDGQTYGDEEECIAEARRAGARRIGMTAMGIGEDWNDVLLDEVASQSGGISAYISSPSQVRKLLRQRVRGLGRIFAQDLKLKLQFAEGVWLESAFRITPYLDRLSPRGGTIELGALQADAPLSVMLEVGVGQKPAGEHRLLRMELMGDIKALGGKKERLQRDVSVQFQEAALSLDAVPPDILGALSKITIYRMQERAWDTLEEGDVEEATRQLELMATRLFDLGESQLARAAMLEAGTIAKGGVPTSKGRKQLKYGTRGLTIASRRGSYD